MTIPDFAARPQLSEDVARHVRQRIFEGSYAAGSYVRLEQLAAELGISVTPVREALLELRAEGLLTQRPHRGFVVLPVTDRDIADVSNVQAHIGGELAARAAANITDEQIAELKDLQSQLEDAYEKNDHERAVRLNHEFHRAINVAADSPKLSQLMGQITRFAPESVFPAVSGWPARSMKDHRRVLAALEHRDGERARTAMSEHFIAGVEPMVEHLLNHGVVDGTDLRYSKRDGNKGVAHGYAGDRRSRSGVRNAKGVRR
jgi:DNA-binding GntR family transcriptional regulator